MNFKTGLIIYRSLNLFCNSKGKRASLFVIKQNDVGIRFGKERKYIVKEGDFKVTLWKESEMVYAMVI